MIYEPGFAPYYRITLFILIIAVSIFVEFFYQPYELTGSSLITNPNFSKDYSSWKLTGDISLIDKGYVSLKNESGEKAVALTQEISLPPNINDLVLTAQARSKSIIVGNKPWNSGRVVMASYLRGSTKPDYHFPHELFRLAGTTDWQEYSELFHVYTGVDRMKLQIQLLRVTGSLEVKNLKLYAAVYKNSWAVIKVTMITSSLIFLIWVFSPYYLTRRGRFEYAALGSLVLIVIFTAMPTALKNNIYGLLKDGVALMNDALASSQSASSAKAAVILTGEFTYFFAIMHYLFFGLASYLLLLSTPHWPVINKLYDLFALAVITECIQVFVRDRGPSLVDVGVDMAGVMTGLALWYVWRVVVWKSKVVGRRSI